MPGSLSVHGLGFRWLLGLIGFKGVFRAYRLYIGFMGFMGLIGFIGFIGNKGFRAPAFFVGGFGGIDVIVELEHR